ncbi:MAG: Na/Pi symporter [Candidatus Latescibacteria bacterium]|nr:Na/Pi symporter [Candidatus Latescibacterota bacterium]
MSVPDRLKPLLVVLYLYLFLYSIKLLGHSFKLFGKGFAETLLNLTSDPFVGLLTGIVATTLVQSSSTTTSIVVGLVAGGGLSLTTAIPIIMGANIGTTITNTLVSVGHVGDRVEFRRAFSAGVVHDFFNISAVVVLFPLELRYGIIARSATWLEHGFAGVGGVKLFNPLKAIINPAIALTDSLLGGGPYVAVVMAVIAAIFMFGSLAGLIRTMRSLMLNRIEVIIHRYLFRNDVFGLIFGIIMTIMVQSSSITTSLIIPLAGAGLVTLRQIFPYTLGANLGTTVTAMLAALATQHEVAITVAFSHLVFNILGISIFYPLKQLPISLANFVGSYASQSKSHLIGFVSGYLGLYLVPLAFIIFR